MQSSSKHKTSNVALMADNFKSQRGICAKNCINGMIKKQKLITPVHVDSKLSHVKFFDAYLERQSSGF